MEIRKDPESPEEEALDLKQIQVLRYTAMDHKSAIMDCLHQQDKSAYQLSISHYRTLKMLCGSNQIEKDFIDSHYKTIRKASAANLDTFRDLVNNHYVTLLRLLALTDIPLEGCRSGDFFKLHKFVFQYQTLLFSLIAAHYTSFREMLVAHYELLRTLIRGTHESIMGVMIYGAKRIRDEYVTAHNATLNALSFLNADKAQKVHGIHSYWLRQQRAARFDSLAGSLRCYYNVLLKILSCHKNANDHLVRAYCRQLRGLETGHYETSKIICSRPN